MNHAADAAERRLSRRKLLTASSTLGVSAVASGAFADDAPLRHSEMRGHHPRPDAFRTRADRHRRRRGRRRQRTEGVPSGDSLYDDVTRISISYLTDEERLTSYLPRPYELDGPPVTPLPSPPFRQHFD